MQKVEGSSPFSRFGKASQSRGFFVSGSEDLFVSGDWPRVDSSRYDPSEETG